MNRRILGGFVDALVVAVLLSASHVLAADQPADPIATREALVALLASSDAVIPKTSSCQGDYGQRGRVRVKHLLAMQLAYLYAGENVIVGHCAASSCKVTINHAAGEDVSSAIIEFRLKGGKADSATLHCVMTP